MLKLPVAGRQGVMGRDMLATLLFLLSLVGALGLMHLTAAVAFGNGQRKQIVRAMILMTVVVVLMTGVTRRVRHLGERAAPQDEPVIEAAPVEP